MSATLNASHQSVTVIGTVYLLTTEQQNNSYQYTILQDCTIKSQTWTLAYAISANAGDEYSSHSFSTCPNLSLGTSITYSAAVKECSNSSWCYNNVSYNSETGVLTMKIKCTNTTSSIGQINITFTVNYISYT